ncbi:MAG: Fic family protein [Chloroflexota bacterium]|nr:Fic family protein [Chloroflexota bacterium]
MNAKQFWETFSFEYNLNQEDLFTDLIAIEGHKQAALNLMLPPEWRAQLDRLNRVRAVHGTTAIEGNPFTEAEVDLQIFGQPQGRESRQLSKEQLQIRNAQRAQEWVSHRFVPGSSAVTLEDLLTMHQLVTEESDEGGNVPGRLRSYMVKVGLPEMGGVHYGAPHETLGELMEEFISFLHSRGFQQNHPVIKALLAHFFLVTVHPFGDGNGRVSRLLEAGILFQSEYNIHGFYGLSNYFYRNEVEYKQLLQECRQGTPFDVTPFIQFGVRGFAEELTGINNFVKNKLNRLFYRQMLEQCRRTFLSPRRRILNDREFNLLNYLLSETEPTDPFSESGTQQVKLLDLIQSHYYRGAYSGLSQRTFSRELSRLREEGFIKLPLDSNSSETIELDFNAIAKYTVG